MDEAPGLSSGGPSVTAGNQAPAFAQANDNAFQVLQDSIRALPREHVKHLLSNGVCPRCILRLFSLHEQLCSLPSMETSLLSKILYELTDHDVNGISSETKDIESLVSDQDLEEETKVCSVCLGVLQFMYNDDNGILVKKDCPNDFTAEIAHFAKQEGHQFDSFSLEVSLPQNVVENEQSIWLCVKEKYNSESWFLEKHTSESISIKDFLKMSMTKLLEMSLGIKPDVSSLFRIRLTYALSDTSAKNQTIKENNGFNKRRKTEGNEKFRKRGGEDVAGSLKFPQEKVNCCCSLVFQCYRTSVYIGGRYLKYSRNVSQTRWIIDDERMGEASIEEIIGGNILPLCRGDNYKFHAAGREDIDVRMLGTGRPFMVEIQNARILPSDELIKDMEKTINSLESKYVKVKNLKVLGNQDRGLVHEGESEKQKQYAALVWISRPLEDGDVQTLASLKDMQILQKTPIRVLHRRSPLEREKTIHWMKIERVAGSCQYFLLHLCTQAGTYIKEFVHGDLGRTDPSVGSILGCRTEILRLDVTDVKMDWS